jgi:hypothetical protein
MDTYLIFIAYGVVIHEHGSPSFEWLNDVYNNRIYLLHT